MLTILKNSSLSLHEKISILASEHSFLIEGHSDTISQIAISPDHSLLATASLDKSLRVWDTQTKSQVRQYLEIQGGIYSILISASNKYLICGTGQKQVIVFDLRYKTQEVAFEGSNRIIWKLATTTDTKYIISASIESAITVWNFFKRIEACKLLGHTTGVTDLIVFQDKFLVSGGFDKHIIIWDLLYMEMKFKILAHTGYINEIKISDNGLIFSCSQDGSIKVWDLAQGIPIQSLNGHLEAVTSINLNANSQKLVSGSIDKTVRVWSLSTQASTLKFEGHEKPIIFVGFSKNDKFAVSGSSDCIKCWDIENKNLYANFFYSRIEFRKGIVADDHVIAGASDYSIKCWNLENKEERKYNGHLEYVSCLKVVGGFVITGGNDGSVRVWNIAQKKQVACLVGHVRFVNKIGVTQNLKYFVSGSKDRYYCIWKNPVYFDLEKYGYN